MINQKITRTKLIAGTILALVLAFILSLLIFKGKNTLFFSEVTPLDMVVSSGTVKENDVMSTLLTQKNLSYDVANKVLLEIGKNFNLRRMKPKHNYEVHSTTNGVFQKFVYHDDATHAYVVSRSSLGVYANSEISQETIWKEKIVRCEVKTFLWQDLLDQGFDENFVANFISELGDYIFPWQIDFFTEQRPGDLIEVLIQQEYIAGTEISVHRLKFLAASYAGKATRKKENLAIRYRVPDTKKDDFYDLEGRAIRKAFLRAPFTMNNFRISSNYNPKRFHPILRVYRPHHGTDYAAATGTRVSSVGKGAVIFAGWKKGYGNTVEVRHNSTYVSRYGHLSKIAVMVVVSDLLAFQQ